MRLILACAAAGLLLFGGSRAPGGGADASVSLSYVALGDSLAALPGYVDYNRENLVADSGASVQLTNLGVSGWTSRELRDAVEGNRTFRDALSGADVVTIDIGMNDLQIARARYHLGTCEGSDGQDCLRAAVTTFGTNWSAILSQVDRLTAPRRAVVRVMDVYYPFAVSDGTDAAVLASYWSALNAHIASSMKAREAPLAGVFAEFNGASGTEDPVAKGYIAPDGLHLSDDGARAIAALFRTNGWGGVAANSDSDDVPDRLDNCIDAGNADQANHDAEDIDLSVYGKRYNDLTWPNSDAFGDACDSDDDNDGLTDAAETSLPSGACPAATAATDPAKRDSDGDGVMDAAECVMGIDPASAASKPVAGFTDSDRDGLPDGTEALIGTNGLSPDSDSDGVLDGMEVRRYGSNPLAADSDADGCPDRLEVASINADRVVNSADLSQVFQSFGNAASANYVGYFDMNGDSAVNSIDLMYVVRVFGYCA